MDLVRPSCTEWHREKPAHTPWWCWFDDDPSEESEIFLMAEVSSEVSESELTRFFFLQRFPTVTERLQSECKRQERPNKRSATWLTDYQHCLDVQLYLSNQGVWNVRSTSGLSTVSSHFPSSNSGTKKRRTLGKKRREIECAPQPFY